MKKLAVLIIPAMVMLTACKEESPYEGTWLFKDAPTVELELDLFEENGKTQLATTRRGPYEEERNVAEVTVKEDGIYVINTLSGTEMLAFQILPNGEMEGPFMTLVRK